MPRLAVATSCPTCGSNDVRAKSMYKRKVRTLDGVEVFPVTQHCCRRCRTTFTDVIEGVKSGCQIADEVKRKAIDLYLDGPDLEGVRKIMGAKIHISAPTIWRAVHAAAIAAQRLEAGQCLGAKLSGFACVDEKFISVHGRKRPQFFAIDPTSCLLMGSKLLRNREETAITRELRKLKRQGVKVCISDDLKSYAPSCKKLGMRHQKCHFHATNACHRIMKKKHIQKRRKEKFLGWLFRFLDSKNLTEAKARLRVIGRIKKEKRLKRFIKSFLFDWQDYFTYLEFPGCPKTSNPIEQFNRRFEQKRQTMHGFRKEKTAKSFTALFCLHSAFRRFEAGKNKDKAPLEIAGVELGQKDMYCILPP